MNNISKLITLSLSSYICFANPALAEEGQVVLAPASKWNIDYARDSCGLLREFGQGEQKVSLLIYRLEISDDFEMRLIGHPIAAQKPLKIAKIQFGAQGNIQDRNYTTANRSDGTPALIFNPKLAINSQSQDITTPTDQITVEQEKAVEYIKISNAVKNEVILETGPMDKAFEALRTCTNDLVSSWGIDTERLKNATRQTSPKGNPASWLRPEDYPIELLRDEQQGIINFRVIVNEKGKVSQCFIQQSIGNKNFRETVCQLVKRRAKFNPALDKDGNPMASYYINKVRFQIPN